MSDETFLNTNVLNNAVSSAVPDSAGKTNALNLVELAKFGLAAQVLQEFYVNVTRKIARPFPPDEGLVQLEQFRCFPIVWTNYPFLVAAAEISLWSGISYRGAAIITAADSLEASIVHSEDLNDGQCLGSVWAVYPFLPETHDGGQNGGSDGYG